MTKKEMKDALIKNMKEVLPVLMLGDALILLDQFEKLFEMKKYAEKEKGWKKYYYYTIGYSIGLGAYIRDVRVNSMAGKYLFGNFAKFGTLTATLWRIKKAEIKNDGLGNIYAYHPKYGNIDIDRYKLAMQICEVLNNYDEGHC